MGKRKGFRFSTQEKNPSWQGQTKVPFLEVLRSWKGKDIEGDALRRTHSIPNEEGGVGEESEKSSLSAEREATRGET